MPSTWKFAAIALVVIIAVFAVAVGAPHAERKSSANRCLEAGGVPVFTQAAPEARMVCLSPNAFVTVPE